MIEFLTAHWAEILAAVNAGIAFAIAVAVLIPGEQPEKALKAIADAIGKFSRK
jgi:hypothetical protein